MKTRPVYKLNYKTTISYTKPDASVAEGLEMYFTSISGGNVEFDSVEEHIEANQIFKSSSLGMASVTDLTFELGSYHVDDSDSNESATQSSFMELMTLHKLDDFSCKIQIEKIIPQETSGFGIAEIVTYEDCLIKSINTGDFSSTGEEILIQQMVVKPRTKEIKQGDANIVKHVK